MTSVRAEPRDGLLELGLCDLAAAIRRREFSASEAVDAALTRIAVLDGRFHAFCTVDPDAARDVAERIDQRLYRGDAVGPLAGVPVAVKDLLCTRGLRTTFGSAAYADYVPEEDDIAVARLQSGRRGDCRQNQHLGIRLRRCWLQFSVSGDPQSLEYGTRTRRLERGIGSSGRHRHGAACARQ